MARKVNVGAMVAHDVFKLDTPDMQVVQIPLSQLIGNEHNFFVVEDVQELADDIAMNGLYSPLTACAAGDGKYRIVAGHRRRKALELLGRKDAPCIVKTYDGEDSEMVALIQSNLTSRELTYYEKMEAVIRLEKALRSMKARGVELPGRLRDHLAEQTKESASAVHRMQYIHKNLSPALLDALRREKIGESVADELAHSPKKVQEEFEQRLARGETFRAQDVKAARDKPTVSDGVVDAFLLRHIASPYQAALYRVLHDSQRSAAIQLIPAVKDALHYSGYQGLASEGVWFDLSGSGLEVKKPFCGKLSWSQIVQRLRGMVENGKIAPPADTPEEPAPEAQTLRRLDEQMRQAVIEPKSETPHISESEIEAHDKIIVAGKETGLPCAAWFSPDVQPPVGARIIAQDKDGFVDEGKFLGGEIDYSVVLWDEVVRWTIHPDDEVYAEPVQQVAVPQPAPVWHPYPDEKPEEGQKVLTMSHNIYTRNNYALYIYRAGSWYLPEMPDDGLMTPDVRWWSAALPPEEVK
ncbi:ParB/RepB/Spo0J family partition protein [Agathobaculum sp. Marseille-P7918]|uniref:ParB/RepB/Spo0J family partition protein n=1 Tax=Agathobaculum sp. Marseille-P7918 TaxID=2479843 RepID=UPI0013DE4AAF|nr:ParB/RepB/Spo0J family partition protein [Agathobaculum sp. Marseille-P7918]